MNFYTLKSLIENSYSETIETLKRKLLRKTRYRDKEKRTSAMQDFNKIWKYQEKIQINESNDIINHVANLYDLALSIIVSDISISIESYILDITIKCKACLDLSPELFRSLERLSDDFHTKKLRKFLVISSGSTSSTQSLDLLSDEELTNETPVKKNTM